MATNYHSDLPNDQIHNPKDFVDAHKNSIIIKNDDSDLKWASSTYTLSSTITCVADVGGNLNNMHWVLYSSDNSAIYHVWYNVDTLGEYTCSSPYVALPVAISSNDTAATIATATATAVNSLAGITAASPVSGQIAITTITNAKKPEEGSSTDFGFLTTEAATGEEYLQTDINGKIKWGSAPGGGGCSNSWGVINTPGGSFPTANGCADTLVLSTQHGRNIEIEGNNTSDTVYYTPHTSVHFRGNVETGLEGNTKYCFRHDNNKDQKFFLAMGSGGILNAAQAINAGKMIPNAGSILRSVTGYISAPNAVVCHLYLYRYAFTCGEDQGAITPTLVAQTPAEGITASGNNTAFCFDLNITTTTYGDYDILVPAFSFGAETASSARTMWKITMY